MHALTYDETSLIRQVSPQDQMYAADKDHGDWYWRVGRSAIDCIGQSLQAAGKPAGDVKRILDLPCGHGRVLRYLKLAFPEAEITACDLYRDGVDFCAETFGAQPLYSQEDPAKIGLKDRYYDLIWVGSLFTHLDAHSWRGFLKALSASLSENGILVFSAHGRFVYRRFKGISSKHDYGLPYWRDTMVCYSHERTGFAYGDYYGCSNGYGISLSDPAWVGEQVRRNPELTLVYFAAAGWHGVHDVYACGKLTDADIAAMPVSTLGNLKAMIRNHTPSGLVRLAKSLGLGKLK